MVYEQEAREVLNDVSYKLHPRDYELLVTLIAQAISKAVREAQDTELIEQRKRMGR